jgi:hypothetical protein
MKLLANVFRGLGIFLILDGIAFGLITRDIDGLVLLLTVAGGALVIGSYLIRGVHRAEVVRAAGPTAPVAETEPHVAPTIWPLLFAVSMIGLVLGALGQTWALVEGGILLLIALLGWALDVRRQWQHHHAAGSHQGDVA